MWYQELEKRVVPRAYEATKVVCAHAHHAELQLENGSIKIVVDRRPTPLERSVIDAAVRHALTGVVDDASKLVVRAERGFPLLYTSHLDQTTQHAKVVRDLHDITDYSIRVEELEGLRHVYARLLDMVGQHDFVATTALGGLPGLLYLLRAIEGRDRPTAPPHQGAFLEALQHKYHLFPGLLWTGGPEPATIIFDWLAGLPAGSSVLLFDTGTDGNGVRQLAGIIETRLPNAAVFGPAAIRIEGIVDGHRAAQMLRDDELIAPGGTVRLRVEYSHVPRVLTEDCQRLIGYESLRKQLMLQPLTSNAVMNFKDDDGKTVAVIGAASGAGALLETILHGITATDYEPDLAAGISWFTRAMVLSSQSHSEAAMLNNAYQHGLVSEERYRREAQRVQERYRRAAEAETKNSWDFEKKGFRSEPNT